MDDRGRARAGAAAGVLAVALLAAAIYAPVAGYGFVRYDDPNYVFLHPRVSQGLTWDNARWAATAFVVGNWHPVTMLSHMLDVTLFGPSPGAHHLVNVGIHALNAALLFLLLRAGTGRAVPAFVAAALFAVHPLQVESVAWIAQRKSLLSTAFLLLALAAYGAWTRRGGAWRYAAALAAFAAGLASKPMVVTLPVLLLVVDVWPLGRPPVLRRLVEKIPFALMAAAAAAVTYVAQESSGAVGTVESHPWGERIANAVFAYAWYPVKLALPTGLSLFYPMGLGDGAVRKVAASAALLAAIAAAAVVLRRRAPYVAAGTAWYAVALLPVAGLVQFGTQIVADRYAYVPCIGLLVAAVWALAAAVEDAVAPTRRALAAAGIAAVAAYGVAAAATLAPWKDTVTLFERGVLRAPGNAHALVNLGLELVERGRLDEGIGYLERGVAIVPLFRPAQVNLGYAYAKQGNLDRALEHYERARAIRADDPKLALESGRVLAQLGRQDEAEARLREAVALDPGVEQAQLFLGTLLFARGRAAEAMPFLDRAVDLAPGDARAWLARGLAREGIGRRDEAIADLREARRLDPGLERAGREIERLTVPGF